MLIILESWKKIKKCQICWILKLVLDKLITAYFTDQKVFLINLIHKITSILINLGLFVGCQKVCRFNQERYLETVNKQKIKSRIKL